MAGELGTTRQVVIGWEQDKHFPLKHAETLTAMYGDDEELRSALGVRRTETGLLSALDEVREAAGQAADAARTVADNQTEIVDQLRQLRLDVQQLQHPGRAAERNP